MEELIEDIENPTFQEAGAINLGHSVIESIRLILNSDESELEKLQDILKKVPVMELAQSRLAMLLALHK